MSAVRLAVELPGDALEVFDRFTEMMLARWPEVGLEPHAGGPVKLWRPGSRLEAEWREPAWPEGVVTTLTASFETAGATTRIGVEHAGFERLGEDVAHRYETLWRDLLESLRPAAER
jgi:hypothetical protein